MPSERTAFNHTLAPRIAASIGIATPVTGPSTRFAWFESADRCLVVAGPQEGEDVDLALVYGMTWATDRRLVLALPRDRSNATRQRLPWFTADRRPELWLFMDDDLEQAAAASREAAIGALERRL